MAFQCFYRLLDCVAYDTLNHRRFMNFVSYSVQRCIIELLLKAKCSYHVSLLLWFTDLVFQE
jgi:hypothetical protein